MTIAVAWAAWLIELGNDGAAPDGLVRVDGYSAVGRPAEEVLMMERAASYGAHAVFFEASSSGKAGVAQAFIFLSDGPADDPDFGLLDRRLWSWGGVPLVYRRTAGLVQLFRCAHRPDFISPGGDIICKPVRTLKLASTIATHDAWWNAERLRNGTLWDDPNACKLLLSAAKSAHRHLVDELWV